ncbi:hypothetical protein [Corynebacterium kutscheri]|nr:hypothetical protein [Corynebacterium kutscheri]
MPSKLIKSMASATILIPLCLGSTVAQAQELPESNHPTTNSHRDISSQHAFVFEGPDGTRTFDTERSFIVPRLLDGDKLSIDGNVINVHNIDGQLVASIKADLPEDFILQEVPRGIIATNPNENLFRARCIDNKWVSLGLNITGDLLVCAPFGAATGGIGGFGCSAAIGAGVTAISC